MALRLSIYLYTVDTHNVTHTNIACKLLYIWLRWEGSYWVSDSERTGGAGKYGAVIVWGGGTKEKGEREKEKGKGKGKLLDTDTAQGKNKNKK